VKHKVSYPVPSNLEKAYPSRGPLQQYRFSGPTAFDCFRCGQKKKSKLLTIYRGDWGRKLCNGCYGRLLSIYEVKAGTAQSDERAELLTDALLALVSNSDKREAERLYLAAERRAEELSPESLRFISTAEFVASHLDTEEGLEWSPAVIGLCKAVEYELVHLVVEPLAEELVGYDLAEDKTDKDLSRIASYCADRSKKPPELGAIAHFLQTALHSQSRRETSKILKAFFRVAADWTGSTWILDKDGLLSSVQTLTRGYRNRAAHIEELSSQDYYDCRHITIGENGLMWQLIVATGGRR
jgi:hypothetical protein